jgi:hypothetical protein
MNLSLCNFQNCLLKPYAVKNEIYIKSSFTSLQQEISRLLQASQDNLMTAVYRERLQPHLAHMPSDVLEGLQRVCQEKRYAFMAPVEETVEYMPSLNCAVVYLPQGLFTMKYAIVLTEHSPYVGIFRYTCVSPAGLDMNMLVTYQLLMLCSTQSIVEFINMNQNECWSVPKSF